MDVRVGSRWEPSAILEVCGLYTSTGRRRRMTVFTSRRFSGCTQTSNSLAIVSLEGELACVHLCEVKFSPPVWLSENDKASCFFPSKLCRTKEYIADSLYNSGE